MLVLAAEKQAPDPVEVDEADILFAAFAFLGQKILDVKRGVSEPFCHEDYAPNLVNRETLLRCRGSTSRV